MNQGIRIDQMNQKARMSRICIDGIWLKRIAVLCMCIDHLAAVVLKGYFQAGMAEIPESRKWMWELCYNVMRAVGRTAFPLFAFLLAEGFYHTGNRKKYGLRLFAAALLSEIPFDLAVYGAVFDSRRQNTIFTLFLGYLVLNILEKLKALKMEMGITGERTAQTESRTMQTESRTEQAESQAMRAESRTLRAERRAAQVTGLMSAAVLAGGCVLAWLLRLDYSWRGILLIFVFYFFHEYKTAAAAAGFCIFSGSPFSIFAFLFILFYNGKREKPTDRKTAGMQYMFYLFYPLHLLVLWWMLQILTAWF